MKKLDIFDYLNSQICIFFFLKFIDKKIKNRSFEKISNKKSNFKIKIKNHFF